MAIIVALVLMFGPLLLYLALGAFAGVLIDLTWPVRVAMRRRKPPAEPWR